MYTHAEGDLHSPCLHTPIYYELTFLGAHVCKVTFKHFPQFLKNYSYDSGGYFNFSNSVPHLRL